MGMYESVVEEINERNPEKSENDIAAILSKYWSDICENQIEPMILAINDRLQDWMITEGIE